MKVESPYKSGETTFNSIELQKLRCQAAAMGKPVEKITACYMELHTPLNLSFLYNVKMNEEKQDKS